MVMVMVIMSNYTYNASSPDPRQLPTFENISPQEEWQNGYPVSIIRPAEIGN